VPFTRERAAVVYVRVQNVLCVTLDYMQPRTERDPMLVRDGSVCGDHKVSSAEVCGGSREKEELLEAFLQQWRPTLILGADSVCVL